MENTTDLPAFINWIVYNLSLILKIGLVVGLTIVALRFQQIDCEQAGKKVSNCRHQPGSYRSSAHPIQCC